ncbi:MAG: DUF11 domain-containing protein, partial [Propionibacteriaceae bacterium]|nr:DUF11 domain-containing protein [Propionibacteriaceae bacterium]
PGWTLAKTADPESGSLVAPGDVITYRLTATPIGGTTAGVVITDNLSGLLEHAVLGAVTAPAGTKVTVVDDQLTWTIGSLSNELTLVYRVTVNADARGAVLRNTVVGDGDRPPLVCAPDDPCSTDHEVAPGWTLNKTADPESGSLVAPGDVITYRLTATPLGGSTADVVVTDDLSKVLAYATVGTVTAPVGTTAVITGNQLTWTIGELSNELVLTYRVTVNADAHGAVLKNTVVGDGDTPPLACSPDDPCSTDHGVDVAWTLAKTASPASGSLVAPGDVITYRLTATPMGGSTTGVVITDDLSGLLSHATLGAVTAPPGTTAIVVGDRLTWTIGSLSNELTLVYRVTVDDDTRGAVLKNTVVGDGDAPPLACSPDDPCSTDHAVDVAWTLAKTSDPGSGSTVVPGDVITYRLTATPIGGTTTDVVVTDDLSKVLAHATVGTVTAPAGTTAVINGDQLTWTIGELSNELTLVYRVTVNDDAHGAVLKNTVVGDGDTPPLACSPDDPCSTDHGVDVAWTLAKTASPASGSLVAPGDVITYRLTATPLGGTTAGVVITDDLSKLLAHAALGAVTAPPGTTATVVGDQLTWTIGSLSNDLTLVYRVTVNADAHGAVLKNTVVGDGDTPPLACSANDPCSTDHGVDVAWTLAKTSEPGSGSLVAPGDVITYRLTAIPLGGTSTGVVITDDLSGLLSHAALGAVTAPAGTTAVVVGDRLTWTIGELSNELTVTYSVTVNADAHGAVLKNTVTGDGDAPPLACSPDDPCSTDHGVDVAWTLAKTSDPASGSTVVPGDVITYRLTATPLGGTATGVVVTDDLSGLLSHAALGAVTAPPGTTAIVVGNRLTWTVGPLSNDLTLVYRVTVNNDARGTQLRNTVVGDGDTPPLACSPDDPCSTDHGVDVAWTLAKTSDPASGSTVAPGDVITYRLTATPLGGTTAGVVVTDDLSKVLDNATLGQVTAPAGTTVTVVGDQLTWTIGSLSNESTLVYRVTVNNDARRAVLKNTVVGDGDTPPLACSPDDPCSTEHSTPPDEPTPTPTPDQPTPTPTPDEPTLAPPDQPTPTPTTPSAGPDLPQSGGRAQAEVLGLSLALAALGAFLILLAPRVRGRHLG